MCWLIDIIGILVNVYTCNVETIIKLKSDLQNERDKKEDLCISMKSGETCNSISEGYEKISTKTTNQIKDFTEKLNRNITETISQTLQSKIDPLIDNMRKISENSVSFTKSLGLFVTRFSSLWGFGILSASGKYLLVTCIFGV
jgi:gas vesicle protein